ncbi:P-loop containing nucleoside triphosphate hydrolase protein [Crassisporium funariophilum]|nr:P-loop containing nucleoside triphosphate hydrolase protein [Crassisporium funariophilum]
MNDLGRQTKGSLNSLTDGDEEGKDARSILKARSSKKRANVILVSDDELETPKEKEVIFGARKKVRLSEAAIKLMPRFLTSTKMNRRLLQIIVSQWTGCLSLVSDYTTENGIAHVKYQDMNRLKRDQAVQVFMSREKARVMLMSLNVEVHSPFLFVGLNLTRVNNVISLDLGWSQAIESQAFDRVHRLDQTRKVHAQRVVIADTVEYRILKNARTKG